MNDQLVERAKQAADALRKRVEPHLEEARDETRRQTENALAEVGRLFRQAARTITDDISKRR